MSLEDVNTKEFPKVFGLRQSALLEMGLFFVLFLLIDIIFGAGNRFADISPHPFWIIVLLMGAQYGTNEALVATLVSTIALWLGNLPPQSIDQDMYEYVLHIAANPLMWLTAAIVIGELRNKHIRERRSLQDELEKAGERETTIATSYDRLKTLKEGLEVRIAGQFRSSVEAYKAAKSIEKLHPTDVLQGVEQLVRAVMNPEKFSVFMLNNNKLELTINSGWKENDPFPMVYEASTDLYQQVIGRQTVLCVANSEHEARLSGHGMIAGPLVSPETGEVVGMLKVEKMGFLDLNLSSIETFKALCQWVGMAFVNARQFQVVKESSVINPDHNMYSLNYFRRHTDYITSLAKRVGFDVSMVVVKLANANDLEQNDRRNVALMLADSVNKTLRTVDLAFDYQAGTNGGEEFAIVLPSTNQEGARIVLEKLRKSIDRGLTTKEVPAQVSYTLHVLHQQQVKIA